MATAYTSANLASLNRKQVRAIARNIGVAQHNNLVATTTLKTAVKAK
jgi:hypothetical protein